MKTFRKILAVFVVFVALSPMSAPAAWQFGARSPEPEELDKVISKITSNQSKNIKTFESKAREYFFDTQKRETIVSLVKDFPPGEAVVILVLSDLSKKSVVKIATMRKSGKAWPEIADLTGVKLKAVIKEIKAFRSGAG